MNDRQAVEFFHEYAGWSYRPGVETPEQGRRKGAVALARAERWAADSGITFGWQWDHDVAQDTEYEVECLYAVALDTDARVLASLGGITDPTPEYRRVVEAELALEVLADPRRLHGPVAAGIGL